jgi:hypothetical protein
VAFVSLTNMIESGVAPYVKENSISWPCGYGAPLTCIAALGAYKADEPARMFPGYEVTPTLYVIGRDGRVRWNDKQVRLRHEDPGPLLKELEEQIEQALQAAPAPAARGKD